MAFATLSLITCLPIVKCIVGKKESINGNNFDPIGKIGVNHGHNLKKESTNSYLLNTCRSSIPSPTPIYFTGI